MARCGDLIAAALLAAFPSSALGAPGDLDPSFDTDGRKTIDLGGNDGASAVAVQPDRKIVIAGLGHANYDMPLVRLNPDGSFDSSFDGDGISGADFGGKELGYAMALQPDGKIVVAGSTRQRFADVAVARFMPGGTLDPGFNLTGVKFGGKKTIDLGGEDSAYAVALQPDGKILIAGNGNANHDMALVRLNPNGSFDTGFDGDGISGADFGGTELGYALALQPDGRIVVAGATSVNHDIAVARFTATGALDPDFDADGKRTFGFGGADEAGTAIAIQPDRKIVIAGYGNPGLDMALVRLNPDGSFDPSFDGDGISGIDFGGPDLGLAVALQPNGKIVAAGLTEFLDMTVARFQPGGLLDTTFSFDGKVGIDFGSIDRADALALDPDGRILVAGQTTNDVALARLEGDPASGGDGSGGNAPGGGGPGAAGGSARCAGRRATIVGTSRSETLRGTSRADVIVALGGNDRISGLDGNDRICAGAGRDRIGGGTGHDRLKGGGQVDRLFGRGGNDTVAGDGGADGLHGGPGNDLLAGGSGIDRLSGGADSDSCSGGPGRDRGNCEVVRNL